tara:strand:- start:497 stop:652 length:156 start_codon:yes stop_codon:yes gene_type:complete
MWNDLNVQSDLVEIVVEIVVVETVTVIVEIVVTDLRMTHLVRKVEILRMIE